VAGEQQRHDLVADLRVVELGAVLVLRVEQQREDVLATLARAPAAGDLVVDQRVEAPARLLQLRPRRARAAHDLQEVVARPEPERVLEVDGRIGFPRARPVGVEPEQRPHGDAQREVARPGVEVEAGAVSPRLERPADLVAHRVQGRRDPLAVERGQHDPPRAAVEVAVDREQPVAEQRHQVAHVPVAPGEVVGVRDGDVVVGLGPEHEDDVAVEDPQREDGPEALVGVEQQRQRAVGEVPRPAQARRRLAGRERDGRVALGLEVQREAQEGVRRDRRRTRERHRLAANPTGWLASTAISPSRWLS
jgi:hypothetical protein